ncbi:MAG: DUF861 domain-containing protein [Alphaproteobacteria bacterium]|nr:DUF861 domain-containing protein [Alphaproteobacteria bacterium]
MTGILRMTRLGSGPGERRVDTPFFVVTEGRLKPSSEALFADPSGRLKAGIAGYASSALRLDGYPHDEYCFLLEGELTVIDEEGSREVYRPGDAFLLPRGFRGTWHMPNGLKKYYVIFDATLPPAPPA